MIYCLADSGPISLLLLSNLLVGFLQSIRICVFFVIKS